MAGFLVLLMLKKFLVVGHTHNQCDRGFAVCEKVLRTSPLHIPDHVYEAISTCEGMNVHLLSEFHDWRGMYEEHFNVVKGVKSLAEMMVLREKPSTLFISDRLTCSIVPVVTSNLKVKLT